MHIQQINDPDGTKLICLIPEQSSFIHKISLVYYPSNLYLTKHAHDVAQVSLLLSGSAHEINQRSSECIGPGKVRLKPYAYQHENTFGPLGALYLSINLQHDHAELRDSFSDLINTEASSANALLNFQPLLTLFFQHTGQLSSQSVVRIEETIADTLSALTPTARKQINHVPQWLKQAREALIETDLTVQDIAQQLGIHRVHLSRLFKRYFGCTISRFRHAIRVQECIHQLVRTRAQSLASLDHQFSDQSHMNRSFKSLVRTTPTQLKEAFNF